MTQDDPQPGQYVESTGRQDKRSRPGQGRDPGGQSAWESAKREEDKREYDLRDELGLGHWGRPENMRGNDMGPRNQQRNLQQRDPQESNPYGQESDYSGGMDWSRSGSMRQSYGDYGNALGNPPDWGGSDNAWSKIRHYAPWFNDPRNTQGGSARGDGQAARRRRGPKGYVRSDDRLKEDICERIINDPYVDASDVSVEVKQGVVTMQGTVVERGMRFALEDIAEACPGVEDIDNRVRVAPAGSAPPYDTSTASRRTNEDEEAPSADSMQNRSLSGSQGADISRFIRTHTD